MTVLFRLWTLSAQEQTIRAVDERLPKHVVGSNIRRLRLGMGLTQEALAHRSGIHPVELARAERGTRDMRVSTVAKIARGLQVPAKELFEGV